VKNRLNTRQRLIEQAQGVIASGKLVEVQGTAEEEPFTKEQMVQMMDLAEKGIKELLEAQKAE
jgi:ribonuclease PH